MGKNTKHFAEYIKRRKTQPPPLLYKYVPFETARLIIANETLRFSSPLEFNDPFDSQWNFLWQLSTPEFNQTMIERILHEDINPARFRDGNYRDWVLGNRRKHETLSAEQRREHVERMKEELSQGFTFPDQVSGMIRHLRVLCLASTAESIQMWSYYASGHEGVVLAFDSSALESAWELPVKEVQYEEALPKIVVPETFFEFITYGEELPPIDSQLGSDALTLTKAHKWGHENEWRYVSVADRGDKTRHLDLSFPVSALAGVVGGCKCNQSEFKSLAAEAVAKNPQTKLWGLIRHPSRFDLVAGLLEAPQKENEGTGKDTVSG